MRRWLLTSPEAMPAYHASICRQCIWSSSPGARPSEGVPPRSCEAAWCAWCAHRRELVQTLEPLESFPSAVLVTERPYPGVHRSDFRRLQVAASPPGRYRSLGRVHSRRLRGTLAALLCGRCCSCHAELLAMRYMQAWFSDIVKTGVLRCQSGTTSGDACIHTAPALHHLGPARCTACRRRPCPSA